MKKTIALLLTFLLSFMGVLPAAFASDDTENLDITAIEVNKPSEYYLSLEKAIEMAYTDNPQIIANEYKQAATKINIKSAKMDKSALKNSQKAMANANIPGISGLSVTTIETLLVREGYLVNAAEMQDRLAIKELDKIKATIAYNVTQSYYNLVLMDKLVNAADSAYKLALENKAIVDAQYLLGLIPAIDYENADVSVLGAENALNTYKLNKSIAMENLKIYLNKEDENCIIIPTDDIEYEEYFSDVERDLESAVSTRYDLTALKETRDLAEKYFNISKAFTEASAAYNTAYSDFLAADYNYTNTTNLIKLSIRNSYNEILTSASSMDISKRQYEMKLKEYQADKAKYDLGMISNIELTATINELYNAQVAYANAKLTYTMAVEKYKYEITIGL